MRQSLRAVNVFFKHIVDHLSSPFVYLPDLSPVSHLISVRNIITLKGKLSGAVMRLLEIINHPKWSNAWLRLKSDSFGWFYIKHIC